MKIIKLHKVAFLFFFYFFNLLSVRALTRIAGLLHRNNLNGKQATFRSLLN